MNSRRLGDGSFSFPLFTIIGRVALPNEGFRWYNGGKLRKVWK